MSLAGQITALATRIGTEIKAKAPLLAPVFFDSVTVEDETMSPTSQQRAIIYGDGPYIYTASDNPDSAGSFNPLRSQGTIAVPTAVQDGDALGYPMYGQAHDGTDYILIGYLRFIVDGTVSTGVIPTRVQLLAMDDAGATWLPIDALPTRDVLPDGIWKDMWLNTPLIDGAWNAFGGNMNYPTIAAPRESVGVSGTGATGTIHLETLDRTSKVITGNSSADFTINMRGNGTYTLDQTMAVGDQISFSLAVTNGSTPYRATAFTIDGGAVTPKWVGGIAPTAGTPSAVDIYTLVVTKTASATFAVWASMGTVI